MRWFYKLPLRFRSLFRKSHVEQELSDELRFHLERLIEEKGAKGMTPEEARYAALRELGGVEQIKEECRDMRRVDYIENFIQDTRYGLRMLRRNPGFTAIAVLTLSLGIGANTAIFTVVYGALLRPLPYPGSNRLVRLFVTTPASEYPSQVSGPNFLDWREKCHSFEEMAAYAGRDFTLSGEGEAQSIPGGFVSANFFRALGVQPFVGRTFSQDEDQPGQNHVAVISFGFWQHWFGSEPHVVGRSLRIEGDRYTVIGVLPKEFQFPFLPEAEIWQPLVLAKDESMRSASFYSAIARLKPGIQLKQAQDDMTCIAESLQKTYPRDDAGQSAKVVPALDALGRGPGEVRTLLVVLWGAVSLILLIACANVANLLLTRGIKRRREMAIRVALGGGRLRLLWQLLSEAVVLGLLGGAGGLLIAFFAVQSFQTLAPQNIPRIGQIRLDSTACLFVLPISLLTVLLFGLAPATQLRRHGLSGSLKEGNPQFTSGTRTELFRGTLVTCEAALSVILLAGAGLMIRSLGRLLTVNPGFASQHVMTFWISVPWWKHRTNQQLIQYYDQLLRRLDSLPGLQSATMDDSVPPAPEKMDGQFVVEQHPPARPSEAPTTIYNFIGPDYFRTLNIPLIRGRTFATSDFGGPGNEPRVVIVNEALAQRFFPNENVLGKVMKFDLDQMKYSWEVVGVVANQRHFSWDTDLAPETFFPYTRFPIHDMAIMVRTSAPQSATREIASAFRQLDDEVPIMRVESMEDALSRAYAPRWFNTAVFAGFAGLALLLAVTGIYGVISYSAGQRTHEIGIRMALGARKGDVLRMVIGYGIKLTLIGAGTGLLAALGLTRLMATLLYGVKATDPVTFIIVAVVLTGVAALASYIPARRATKVDPMVALRYE
jgi:putative ABC transport system permease protein